MDVSKLNIMLVLQSGGDYTLKEVELLSKRIHQKVSTPVNIFVLSDKAQYDIQFKDFTLLQMENPNWDGWWSKLNLFAPNYSHLRPYLYLDLDTAVLCDVHKLIPPNKEVLYGLRDFYMADKFASGLMWIPNNNIVNEIWKRWIISPKEWITKFRGDQDFLRMWQKHFGFFQDFTHRISSFKPFRGQWLKEIPEGKELICFHGQPRPWEATSVEWVDAYIND